MKNRLLPAAFVIATIAVAASLLATAHLIPPLDGATSTLRWLAIAIFAAHATSRRSLTTWIFVGLFAGVELGYDAPHFASNLQFLGNIFLRLIKFIIPPLPLGFLVT